MEGTILHERSAEAWRLAARQHGVVTRRQLLELGFSSGSIEHRLARGRLFPVMRGIYGVGRPDLTCHGRWLAAVLACGPEAVLSDASAAALWGFGREQHHEIDVSVPSSAVRRRDGIRVHRRRTLGQENRAVQDAIAVTTPAQTLVDLGALLSLSSLERAVNEADKLNRIDPDTLRRELEGFGRQEGAIRLRTLLDRATFRLSDSELESKFRPIARDAGLPEPLTKAWVNGFEVDFFWPDLGLVVETDGLRYHRTPSQQSRALRRDQAHIAAGMTALRFSHGQVHFEPGQVRATLAEVVGRGRGASRPEL
jgi:very-short-patch-repair endonuclease